MGTVAGTVGVAHLEATEDHGVAVEERAALVVERIQDPRMSKMVLGFLVGDHCEGGGHGYAHPILGAALVQKVLVYWLSSVGLEEGGSGKKVASVQALGHDSPCLPVGGCWAMVSCWPT